MSTTPTMFDMLWDEFREFERDPEAHAEKVRLRKLRDERRRISLAIYDLKHKLDYELASMNRHIERYGVDL